MANYCCFFCPKHERAEKNIEDICPDCGRSYGFVLTYLPVEVNEYRIQKKLGRGFYGATYIAEYGAFSKKCVIKISPVEFYKFFDKQSFDFETQTHHRLAQNANHIVDIINAFDANIEFSDSENTKLKCHVAVLDYVDGELLKEYLDGRISTTARSVFQIAIDLLRIQAELEINNLNHNDLHAENLIVEQLKPEASRSDAIDDTIKVWAIDLGSISDESKSAEDRLGDLSYIASHIETLLDRLLIHPDSLIDRDYRVLLALQTFVNGLRSSGQNTRLPKTEELIDKIRETYYDASRHWHPWRNSIRFKGYGDHYNAQTLESWYVPNLLVDPDNRWISEVSKPGPQVITGMRGCGKTMLLRALDIHARAMQREADTTENVVDRIRNDQFVGLYGSAQRLLDLREQSLQKLEHTLTRLFVHYSLQAVCGLIHIQDIAPDSITPGAHTLLGGAVSDFLKGGDELRHTVSIEDLKRSLEEIMVNVLSNNNRYTVSQAPAEVFSHLARNLRECTVVLNSATVFFLLDDVSTRYMALDKIERLMSSLIFQNPVCAFKFTSEWQTIELGLKSPGREHPVRIDRDLGLFDLGTHVYQLINASGNTGKRFVSQIIERRSLYVTGKSQNLVSVIGDTSLEQVARDIATSEETSRKRKEAYRGLSCLTNVCVGDIGDVILLYQDILKSAERLKKDPASASLQSECFQRLSSNRLYHLNRKGGFFKNNALAFAQASHELLVRSYHKSEERGNGKTRLRQYSSIYVRITTNDENVINRQIDGIRDLIDAGIFVFSGGGLRKKTRDSNPTQQFILSYRKIYGLSAYIGLADRDRFELTDDDLDEWLQKPSMAKEILLRNQADEDVDSDGELINKTHNATVGDGETKEKSEDNNYQEKEIEFISQKQDDLFSTFSVDKDEVIQVIDNPKNIEVEINKIELNSLSKISIDTVITGLGFEKRTLESNKYLSKSTSPSTVYAVRYKLDGFSDEILNSWSKKSGEKSVREIEYFTTITKLPDLEGLVLIDISGLSKPIIYNAIRDQLMEKGRVLVCYAKAKQYYPLQDDLENLIAAEESNEPNNIIENLTNVLMGEEGPYNLIRLMKDREDPTRIRALLAFASAKHQRLFSLLDRREYDCLEILTPSDETPRDKVAACAANFVCQNYLNAKVTTIDAKNISDLVWNIDSRYIDLYGKAGANLEIGLTGTKLQTVASAILSVRRRISQAWYLSPKEFDEKRFSKGIDSINVYDISVPRAYM